MNEAELKTAKEVSRDIAQLDTNQKNSVLLTLIEQIKSHQNKILEANLIDLSNCSNKNSAFLDRLKLTESRIQSMLDSLAQVIAAEDPVNQIVETGVLGSGVLFRKIRSPMGVILVIFESRPNVITEVFSLAFKSGNVALLKAGKETLETAKILYSLISNSLLINEIDKNAFNGIVDSNHDTLKTLLHQKKYIDLVIPRGGDALIEFVSEHSKIPVIKNDRGLCHLYLHSDADHEMSIEILFNSKTQRPGVCNSVETVLIHRQSAAILLPLLYQKLSEKKVDWFCCPDSLKILASNADIHEASAESYDTEYLDLKLSCKVVDSIDEAIDHITQHGSGHSEAIITKNELAARKFQMGVDAAAVYWNASTRFTDGFQMGLGGEIGISTQKLHVRGPVGLRELTNVRWLLEGKGQVRK